MLYPNNFLRETIVKGWFGLHWGKALTMIQMNTLAKKVGRTLTYTNIGVVAMGFPEYLFVLE